MRCAFWFCVFCVGIIPAFMLTCPAVILLAIYELWSGQKITPQMLPLQAWGEWTMKMAVKP